MTDLHRTIPPLSARSTALSLLLGSGAPSLPVSALLDLGRTCGVAPATMRVALSRMVAGGDLLAEDGVYSLSGTHLARQVAQDAALEPERVAWTGAWEMVVVTESGRDATSRARLRDRLASFRQAELREGVWMRPANLARPLPALPGTTRIEGRPDAPAVDLVARLWDLGRWSAVGRRLLDATSGDVLDADRFAAMAALVRHLLTDPVLPPDLVPADWPAPAMHEIYRTYRRQLSDLSTNHQGVS